MNPQKIIVLALAVMLSACQAKPDACWSEDTKSQISNLARSIVVDFFIKSAEESILRDGGVISAEQKSSIDKALSLVTRGFHVVSVDQATGNLQCGMSVHLVFEKEGQKVESKEEVIGYQVVKGEVGTNVVTSAAAYQQIMLDLALNMSHQLK